MPQEMMPNVELVMWSQAGDAPLVASVRDRLSHHGYKAEYADAVPDTTAFRRAAKEYEAKDMKVSIWTKDSDIFGQLDKLVPDESSKRIHRQWVATWEMTFDAEKVGFVTAASGDDFRNKYREAKARYVWGDVSMIVQRILKDDGLGAYSPRKSGAVYFVPMASKDQLDKLEAFCDSIGLKFLRYQIPDTDAQKAEIANAISDALESECVIHAEAVEAYDQTTKPGYIENRLEAIETTRKMVEKLSGYLAAKAATLNERLDGIKAQTEGKLSMAQAYRPEAQRGRRIIAGVGAPA